MLHIQNTLELIDVLFRKPQKFVKDLLETIHAAVLKLVTETLRRGGEFPAPIVYGPDAVAADTILQVNANRGQSRESTVKSMPYWLFNLLSMTYMDLPSVQNSYSAMKKSF